MATITLEELLDREREGILDGALAAIRHVGAWHYESAGTEETRRRLDLLYGHVIVAVTRRNLGPIVAYAQHLAAERFAGGYALAEVQSAFNVLEEALWERVESDLPLAEVPGALTTIGTVFGVAKDTMACAYVAAAASTHVTRVDVDALAAGL